MNNVIERLKKIPIPIWIGLGVVLLFIVFIGNRGGGSQAQPVTDATVGAGGVQPSAGTDQQLGNLSQMNQTGFNMILANQKKVAEESTAVEKQQADILKQILERMSAIGGTTQTQVGGAIQAAQNNSAGQVAAASGVNGGGGHEVQHHDPPTVLWRVPIEGPNGSGAGFIEVASKDAASAFENARQGGNTPTGPAVLTN
jgi:hypothetical protein